MSATPKPFDAEAPHGAIRAIIRYDPDAPQDKEMIEAAWGSDPRFSAGVSYRFVRSEGKTFSSHRCLVPASEFQMSVGDKRYRVSQDDGNFFYLAGVWEPPMADWPLAFRIITVAASPEVARYQERHGAIIQRRQVMQWLDATLPEADLLVTPPARLFRVEEIDPALRQQALAL
jgi:putative SOS response-associated peptidase YedK